MKTAISIPDDIFEVAERLARRTKKSRSQLFSDAVREYVARHAADEITDAMDRVCAELGSRPDEFAASAASRILESSEW
jgi:metal-responsive CopG/Arc/MetJ family transcriptional regulator